jgi:UDP-N-acetylmuramoyl-tripeptide--D-alanyl-D-alanine ligase
MFTLAFILQAISPYQPTGQEPPVRSVVIDSRQAQSGSLFVALPGEKSDGHDYVADAFARGAMAALVERPLAGDYLTVDTRQPAPLPDPLPLPVCILVENSLTALQTAGKRWREQQPARIIGITGSVGKTTTKELTHAVLSQRYRTLKSEGSYNNEIGLPLTLLKLRPDHERAVLEMGTYGPGEIALLCELAQPDVGVVTIVGPVHLERMGSIETIVTAKQELVEALPAAPAGVAILNKDDAWVMRMAGRTQARVFTYGLDPSADLWASDIQSMGLEGIRFTLNYGAEVLRNIHVPLLGRHSVHTALRAAAVGLVEGLAWTEIIGGLQALTSQLRLVAVPGPAGSIIIDDTYNSSPESAIAALNLLDDLHGRRLAVLGDMLELGVVEEESHRLVGRRAMAVAHILVAVGARGRLIGEEALKVGMPADRVFIVADTDAATAVLAQIIQPEDIILVKGSRSARLDRVVAALSQD